MVQLPRSTVVSEKNRRGGVTAMHIAKRTGNEADTATAARQRRISGIRNRILSTAMALFERQTVARTYVADIMRAENLTRELFYYYFADKDSLVESVVEAYRERCFVAVAEAASIDGSIDERLYAVDEAAIKLFYDEGCEHSPMARVLYELGLLRGTVSDTARYGATCVREDADDEILRRTTVLLLAGIGLAEVSDPDREVALGQAQRLIVHALAQR